MRRLSHELIFIIVFTYQLVTGVVSLSVPIYASFMGASLLLVGIIGSVGGLIYSFMPLISGILCDRFGRKLFISSSLLLYGVSCGLYILSKKPLMLIPVKILEWVSVAIFWPAVESYIAGTYSRGLGDALKRFNISWGLAMTVAPLLGGLLINQVSIVAPFFTSMLLSLALWILGILIIEEPAGHRRGYRHESVELKMTIRHDGLAITLILITIFLSSSVMGILMSIFPSYATRIGISALEIGIVIFASQISRVITFYFASRIEARIGRARMFLLGPLAFGAASIMMIQSNNAPSFFLCFLAFGFASGICYTTALTSMLERSSSSRGLAAGAFESLGGIGYFLGSLIGGMLYEVSSKAPYTYTLCLSLTIFLAHLRYKGRVTWRSP